MMNSDDLRKMARAEEAKRILSRRNVLDFTNYTFEKFEPAPFHTIYYKILDMFAKGLIKNLIVSMPPQHGKSEGASRRLPTYMLGANPDLRIGLGTYNQTFSRKFNRSNQKILNDQKYINLFPETKIGSRKHTDKYTCNADEFEIIAKDGSFRNVGRGGGITGETIDTMVLDDVYKDYEEANSPVIRESAINWYTTSINTRLHNDSQRLLVFTRWDEGDLIGHIESTEEVIIVTSFSQLENTDPSKWYKINFEAIKTGEPTEIDPRKRGEPLWPERHSLENLLKAKALDPEKFESLYQGNPRPAAGLLYRRFKEYDELPDKIIKIGNYTDTADTGKDKLCSVCYDRGSDDLIYITDVYYTDEPMEITEPATAKMLDKNGTRESDIESNNGGRGFARNVKKQTNQMCTVKWFHQSGNKESRILTNSASVLQNVIMPKGWILKWPEFANDVLRYKRMFSANNFDDAPDTLTGIVEKNIGSQYAHIRRYA